MIMIIMIMIFTGNCNCNIHKVNKSHAVFRRLSAFSYFNPNKSYFNFDFLPSIEIYISILNDWLLNSYKLCYCDSWHMILIWL